MKSTTREWVDKADGDLGVAERELCGSAPVYDAICFHAQQCVEKYLKAWMEEHGLAFQKTHDLVVLWSSLQPMPPGLDSERDALSGLTTYAVAARYPGVSATKDHAEEALETARRICSKITQALGI